MAASVTGSWGSNLLSNKTESTPGNFERLKVAEITAERCGFVKIQYSESEKPSSAYKIEFSENQLNDQRLNEQKNLYSRYDKLAEKKTTNLKYTREYTNQLSGLGENSGITYPQTMNSINPETLERHIIAASTSRSAKNRLHSEDAPVVLGSNKVPRGKITSGTLNTQFIERRDIL